jgi:NADH:ubiquinone oxidoreductase subunit 6 (subunit J)
MDIVFWTLAAVIVVCSILTVTSKRILRAATALLHNEHKCIACGK